MMAENEEIKQVSMSNTKKEILAAYDELLKQYQERKEESLDAETLRQEVESEEVVHRAEKLTADSVVREIGGLKAEIGALLAKVSDCLESEVEKFDSIQRAIQIKDRELNEIYEIERAAGTLAALIELHRQKKETLEQELADRRKKLEEEIRETREAWEKEKDLHADQLAERNTEESRRREREKEEFNYEFEKQKRRAKDQFEEEQARLERELERKRVEVDQREASVSAREEELDVLRQRVESFPQELEAAAAKKVNEITEKLNAEAKSREEFLQKEFEGQRNVFTTRIESLEGTIREQEERIASLSHSQNKAYQQVQEIAVKAIEGASNLKSLSALQMSATESGKKKSQEE